MSAVFKNGKSLSSNTEAALKYTAKVGVMSRDVWSKSFCKGLRGWRNKQLNILLDNDLLKLHNCDLGNFYVLGNYGKKIADELGWSLIDPVNPNQMRHDEIVGHGLYKLESQKICKNWMVEKELKKIRDGKYLIKDQGDKVKYPDAVFDAFMGGSFHRVALEYERNEKTIPRYRSILWSYHKLNRFSMVLFVVESEALKKRIKYSLKHLGRVSLVEQIAFMKASEWTVNPMNAVLELASTKTSFEKLATVKS